MENNRNDARNLSFFVVSGGFSSGLKTSLLLLDSLRSVLVQELEQLSSSVLVQSMRKLGNCWWDLETFVQDDLLALKPNVFGPFHKTCKVSRGLDILSNAKVFRVGFKKRILLGFGRLAGAERCCGRFLPASGLGFRLVIENESATGREGCASKL